MAIVSPLRYPGSKRRLSSYIKSAIKLNELKPKLFVEPFAGGASVSLDLLIDDLVEEIGLSELDPSVAAFWKAVFFDTDWLIQEIESMEITIETWEYYKALEPNNDRERAAQCIFLNRTSFSGIISSTAGPIGGKSQKSRYKLDCRFNKSTIVKRILELSQLKSRVAFVENASWQEVLSQLEELDRPYEDIFYYFDPPFFEKAERLYTYYFTLENHHTLHKETAKLSHPWIMSYDPAPTIIDLYSLNGVSPKRVELLYSAGGASEAKELIVTNLHSLPEETSLWKPSKKG